MQRLLASRLALTANQQLRKREMRKSQWEHRKKQIVSGMQAKKVRRVQSAFEMFNHMMQTPGKSELTLTELRVSISTLPCRSPQPACPGCAATMQVNSFSGGG